MVENTVPDTSTGGLGTVPDTSTKRLERIFNKKIDEGYDKSPTNDRYMVTKEKPRGVAKFPLLLIKKVIQDKRYLAYLQSVLESVSTVGETIPIMYISKNKTAVTLCNTHANKELIKKMKYFCLDFAIYTAPGKVLQDLSFSNLVDIDRINKDILLKEDETVKYFNKEDVEDKSKYVDSKQYREFIQSVLKDNEDSVGVVKVIDELTETEDFLNSLEAPEEKVQEFSSDSPLQEESNKEVEEIPSPVKSFE